MKLVRLILERPASVMLLILAVVVFGFSALTGMPLESMPDMDLPMELVTIVWPGADADSIERLVTEPVEEKCETLTDINTISSTTSDNYAMIQLSYNYSVDLDEAYMELKETMDNMAGELPDGCEAPTIMEISMSSQSTMVISASSGNDGIQSYLEDVLVPSLEGINGVAKVDLSGVRDEYVRVVLDEAKMEQYGLSVSSVASAIMAADFDMPVGSVTVGSQSIALSAYGDLDISSSALSDIPIMTTAGQMVRLRDIVSYLNLYQEEADSVSRYNGEDSCLLEITKKKSASTLSVCRSVEDVLSQSAGEGEIDFWIVSSEADNVMDTLIEVLKTLLTGVVLTMAVLLVFFGDVRASLIVGCSMPLSILLAMVLLGMAGFTFNMMSGTALIIAIGMIVDNSIVVLENCMRVREEGMDFKEAAVAGTGSMIMSIFASTLTTVVVYIPLAMAEGMAGQMAGSLSWTISLVMLSSFVCAATVVPLIFTMVKPVAKKELPVNRVLSRIQEFYGRVMPSLLKHPGRVVAASVGILLASLLLASQLNFVLFNSNYDGSILVEATFRAGTELEVMDEKTQVIEEALLSDDHFSDVIQEISDHTVSFTAYAKDKTTRTSPQAVEEYMERFHSLTGMDVSVIPMGTADMGGMFSASETVDITLSGDDLESLQQGAAMVEAAMADVPGVIHISNPFSQSRTQGRLVIDERKALMAGMSQSSLAMQVRCLLSGMTVTTVDYETKEYDIVLEYPEGKYDSLLSVMDHPIYTAAGKMVTLGDIADIEYTTSLPAISRQDGKFITTLSAAVTESARFEASSTISEAVSKIEFPAGVEKAMSVMDKTSADEISNMSKTLLTAVVLVFLVMAIQFDSPRLSIMVMLCIPFSLAGSFASIFLSGRPMSIMGVMGFLMLFGIVVNNGILLVDAISELRKTMPLGEALVQSGIIRLRPILMTTLTTVLSMMPLVVAQNSGMAMMKEMGFIIIGGLVASTILTLFLMPSFYLLIRGERLQEPKKSDDNGGVS